MKKDPSFLFYPADFLIGTMFMTDEQVGIYIRLLCAQHQHKGFINKSYFEAAIKDHQIIKEKFVESEKGYFNSRLDEVITERTKYKTKKLANLGSTDRESGRDADRLPDSVNENVNTNTIVERDKKFRNEVLKFSVKYPHEMLEKFCLYWTEPNRSRTKMRFEMQPTFEIIRRLVTWDRNNKNKPIFGKYEPVKLTAREQRDAEDERRKKGLL